MKRILGLILILFKLAPTLYFTPVRRLFTCNWERSLPEMTTLRASFFF